MKGITKDQESITKDYESVFYIMKNQCKINSHYISGYIFQIPSISGEFPPFMI